MHRNLEGLSNCQVLQSCGWKCKWTQGPNLGERSKSFCLLLPKPKVGPSARFWARTKEEAWWGWEGLWLVLAKPTPAHIWILPTCGLCTHGDPHHRPCARGFPAHADRAGPASYSVQPQTGPLRAAHAPGARRVPEKCGSPAEVQGEEE